jgi:hypothetical protein
MLHSFRDNSVPESGICCNLPGRSCKDKGVCAVFFKLVGRLASNVSACLVRYSEGICSTLTNIMARDNLRVSAAATRELLPTQAGTFDGRFGVSCDNAINPLKLLQRNETTVPLQRKNMTPIVKAWRTARNVDCPFSRTSLRLCIQMESLYPAALIPAAVRRAV